MEEVELAMSYTAESIEGYFQHSYNSGGDYSIVGKGDIYKARWDSSGGVRQFAVKTDEESMDIQWSSRGLSCYQSQLPFWDTGKDYLVVECNEPEFFPAMNRIAANILEQTLLKTNDIINLFKEERLFWSKTPMQMNWERASGLFGELYFMIKHFPESIPALIDESWTGAEYSKKDFNWNNLQVEVKTAMSAEQPISHLISSLEQLQEDGRPLVMYSLIAQPDEGGSISLSQCVDEILNILSDEKSSKQKFMDSLEELGYIRNHPDMEKFKFSLPLGNGRFYAVKNSFPKLTVDDNPDDQRINIGSYRIKLTNVDSLKLDINDSTSVSEILDHYYICN